MMQFQGNAVIPHDPILEYKEEIKVYPQASAHFYMFLLSMKQAFVNLKLQSNTVYRLHEQSLFAFGFFQGLVFTQED